MWQIPARYNSNKRQSWRAAPIAIAMIGVALFSVKDVALAAQLTDIRVGLHEGYTRVVVDTDAPVTHDVEDIDGKLSVRVLELDTETQIRTVSATYIPLKSISLRKENENSVLLEFESTTPFAIRAFHLPATTDGRYRLVIDLHITAPVSIQRTETAGAQRVKLRFDAAKLDD